MINIIGNRLFDGRVFLRCQNNVLVVVDHLLQSADRLFPSDKKRHDHLRINDDVAKRKYRILFFFRCHFLCPVR